MSGFSRWAVSVVCLLAVSGCGGAPSAPGDVPYGRAVDLIPTGAEAVARCTPVYETMPGWKDSTVGARSFAALPDNARAYLNRIEALTGVPIAMVSTGPDRDETILVHHPFH